MSEPGKPSKMSEGHKWIAAIGTLLAGLAAVGITVSRCDGSNATTTPPSSMTQPPSTNQPSTSGASTTQPAAPAVVHQGGATVKEGESLSFASGTTGKGIDNPDFSFPGGLHQTVSVTSGKMKRTFSAATAESCKGEFTRDIDVRASEDAVEAGNWYCLQSRSGNVAAVLVDDYHYNGTMHVQFTEWNMPA